jgi:hypothetical protein
MNRGSMLSKILLIAFTIAQLFAIYVEGAHLRKRTLGYYQAYYYNSTNSDTSDGDDASYVDDASNSTLTSLLDKIMYNYATSPDEWQTNEWVVFAVLMFLFGSIASMFFMCFVFPCCCPAKARTAYAHCIAPRLVEEDPKKVRLIKA